MWEQTTVEYLSLSKNKILRIHSLKLAKTCTFSRPPARPTAFWTPPRTQTKYFSMVALLIWIFQKNQSQWFGKIIRFFLSVCNIFWLPLINQSHILHASLTVNFFTYSWWMECIRLCRSIEVISIFYAYAVLFCVHF